MVGEMLEITKKSPQERLLMYENLGAEASAQIDAIHRRLETQEREAFPGMDEVRMVRGQINIATGVRSTYSNGSRILYNFLFDNKQNDSNDEYFLMVSDQPEAKFTYQSYSGEGPEETESPKQLANGIYYQIGTQKIVFSPEAVIRLRETCKKNEMFVNEYGIYILLTDMES